MEKLPEFGHIRTYFMTNREQIRGAWQKGEYGWILIVFAVWVIMVVVSISVIITACGIVISSGYKVKRWAFPVQSTMPPKTLIYDIQNRLKDEDGLFHTRFLVSVNIPAGHTDPYFNFYQQNMPQSECKMGVSGQKLVESGSGLASTTIQIPVECITREPVIDSGNLFILDSNVTTNDKKGISF